MDASTAVEAGKGKRATVPKHGKKLENRLWSKWKRGDGKQKERDQGMNPDAAIEVATVCDNVVRTYTEAKAGRRLKSVLTFPHRGAAVVYADEYEEVQRRPVAVKRVRHQAEEAA
jgi:hypothetical protein